MTIPTDGSYINNSFDNDTNTHQPATIGHGLLKEEIIQMNHGDTLQVQISEDGSRVVQEVSARITVTFHEISKTISVPAKMLDPASKEKFLERILLDKVSGQIHSGQVAALMGPSGNTFSDLYHSLF